MHYNFAADSFYVMNLCFDTIPACDRQTVGQTDGIAILVAITALAMQAMRRAVKINRFTALHKRAFL